MDADTSRRLDTIARALDESPASLVCVVGPTATGKTELAIDLAARVGGEIVSADSVQIYRGFDLGSGKPTAAERSRCTHHLVDVVDPLEGWDAATWAHAAEEKLAEIRARGRVPIVCGGTFFWVRALVLGLVEAPRADEALRERHREIARTSGRAALHALLRDVDPESASRLHPNDVVRVSRALEVFELTGKKMSTWQADHGFRDARHASLMFARAHDAADLTARIRTRAAQWLDEGWIDEVAALDAAGYGAARAMTSVGYREVKAHLDGALAREALLDAIVTSTRQFARRQRTWLGSANVTWL
ncbi:MAG: tRNA (adenosine(37)-N6)-dimethylallyltransferase MiaA [Polyangiaceae bacterium]